MRWTLALLVTCLVLPAFPAAGQAAGPLLTDAANDAAVRVGFAGVGQQVAEPGTDEFAAADLVALQAVEAAGEVVFTLQVRKMATNLLHAEYDIDFAYGDGQYRISARPYFTGDGVRAVLMVYAEGEYYDDYEWLAWLDAYRDVGAATLTIHLPKAYLADSEERYPLKGDKLAGMTVASAASLFGGDFAGEVSDRMPDDGAGADFTFQLGGEANGHLLLRSSDPYRVSNGGSTTFIFRTELVNQAPIHDTADLELLDLPEGWEATVVRAQSVSPQNATTVTVLVSVPFKHEHGGVSEFTLRAKSRERPSVFATIQLGVLHTPIPQPAGHHSEMYFHSTRTSSWVAGTDVGKRVNLGMNTLGDHADDEEYAAPHWSRGTSSEGTGWGWWIPLNPGLAMGLDFDLTREGELTLAFLPDIPGDARAAATLFLVNEDDAIVVAEGRSEAQPVERDQLATFTFPMTPTEDADYVPYAPDQDLVLEIAYYGPGVGWCGGCGLGPSFAIHPGVMRLPLHEYHDRIQDVEAAGPRLDLQAATALEKRARPGSTMTYVFNVTNRGGDDRFVAEVAGTDAEAGFAIPEGSWDLAAGATRQITLVVSVPSESTAGEQLEVILLVRSQADPSNMALARTYTLVTTSGEAAPDETALALAAAEAEKDTPGAGALAALAAVAATAAVARFNGRSKR